MANAPAAAPPPAPTPPPGQARVLRADGSPNLRRIGGPRLGLVDLYHQLLRMKWRMVVALFTGIYVAINALFATLFLLGGECIENARPGSFTDTFFFSVQTLATIGYGKMTPVTAYANTLVALESMVGILFTALVTGLVFARFSLPSARVLFSRVAVVTIRDGTPSLIFRCANARANFMVEAHINIVLARNEVTPEGESIRRFYDLPLARNHNLTFALTWTVIHPITKDSPLATETPESLKASNSDVIISMTGIDGTSSQQVHARHSYSASEVRWDERFVDILSVGGDGIRTVNYEKFHDTVPVAEKNRLTRIPVAPRDAA